VHVRSDGVTAACRDAVLGDERGADVRSCNVSVFAIVDVGATDAMRSRPPGCWHGAMRVVTLSNDILLSPIRDLHDFRCCHLLVRPPLV
jgi:hypothetical protein